MSLVVPLSPVPASRPRLSRYGSQVHYTKTYTLYRKQAALHLPTGDEPHFTKQVAVMCEFVIKKPKTTKRLWPRGDTDNYEKALYDAVTKCGCIWKDDDQIAMGLSFKRYTNTNEEPHTTVHIIEL